MSPQFHALKPPPAKIITDKAMLIKPEEPPSPQISVASPTFDKKNLSSRMFWPDCCARADSKHPRLISSSKRPEYYEGTASRPRGLNQEFQASRLVQQTVFEDGASQPTYTLFADSAINRVDEDLERASIATSIPTDRGVELQDNTSMVSKVNVESENVWPDFLQSALSFWNSKETTRNERASAQKSRMQHTFGNPQTMPS
jgi:hypothetical protein